MTLDWKICESCGEFFDIGINLDVCPKCRKEIIDKKDKMDCLENG